MTSGTTTSNDSLFTLVILTHHQCGKSLHPFLQGSRQYRQQHQPKRIRYHGFTTATRSKSIPLGPAEGPAPQPLVVFHANSLFHHQYTSVVSSSIDRNKATLIICSYFQTST